MKNKVTKRIIVVFFVMMFLLPTSSIFAMEEDSINSKLKAQEFAESVDWNCVVTNEDTGSSIKITPEIGELTVMPIENLRSISSDKATGEMQYYQEAVIKVSEETLNSTARNYSGTYLSDQVYDSTYSVIVRLGMYFTQGTTPDGSFGTFRVDGVHVDYETIDSQVYFTKAEVGYRIQGPAASDSGPAMLDEGKSWLIRQAPNSCNRDYYGASSLVKLTGQFFNKKTMLYGTLTRNGGSSWTTLIEASY